jgi:hypothetical protein
MTAIQALLDGTRGDSRLTGIRVVFGDDAPTLAALAKGQDAQPERFYAKTRYSDWNIAAYADKGLLLIASREEGADDDTVRVALLTQPRRAERALSRLSREPTPIKDIREEMKILSETIDVGTVELDSSAQGVSVSSYDVREVKEQIRDRAQRSGVRVRDGEPGVLSMSLSVAWSEKDGGSVSASVTADGTVERQSGPSP